MPSTRLGLPFASASPLSHAWIFGLPGVRQRLWQPGVPLLPGSPATFATLVHPTAAAVVSLPWPAVVVLSPWLASTLLAGGMELGRVQTRLRPAPPNLAAGPASTSRLEICSLAKVPTCPASLCPRHGCCLPTSREPGRRPAPARVPDPVAACMRAAMSKRVGRGCGGCSFPFRQWRW